MHSVLVSFEIYYLFIYFSQQNVPLQMRGPVYLHMRYILLQLPGGVSDLRQP